MIDETERHMLKIPQIEYELLLEARETLMRQGYQKLPDEIVERTKVQSFTRGAVVGLALAALLYLLSRNERR